MRLFPCITLLSLAVASTGVAQAPGAARAPAAQSSATVGFMHEFHGTSGKPFDLRVPDPGASGMAIRIGAIDKLLPTLKKAGVRVLSKDGKLVEWSPTVRNVFVKDPNGLNIELVGIITPPLARPPVVDLAHRDATDDARARRIGNADP